MIKTVKLKNQDELLLVLGIQDSKLRALEKEMRVECFIKYNAQEDGAELSIKGTNSRVDKALAKVKIFANEYNNAVNGNLDYNKRPLISGKEIKKVWPELDGPDNNITL